MEKKQVFIHTADAALLSRADRLNAWLKEHCLSIERIAAALFASLMVSYCYQLYGHDNFCSLVEYYNCINFVVFIPLAVVAFASMILLTARMKWARLIPCTLLFFSAQVGVLWLAKYTGKDNAQFALGVGVFALIIILWLIRGNKLGVPGLDTVREALRGTKDRRGKPQGSAFAGVNKKLEKFNLSVGLIVTAVLAALVMPHIYMLATTGEFNLLADYFDGVNIGVYLLIAFATLAVLLLATAFLKLQYLIPWALLAFTVAVSFLLAFLAKGYQSGDAAYFALGVGLVDLAVVLWLVHGDKLGVSGIRISRRTALIAAAVMFVAATATFGYFTSLKYHNYTDFTFDFGIFSQMFERMAETGQPFTTVERSYMMLHYGVHFSPFFYLLLPGYYIFRTPVYLFFVQAAGIAAGVFAVWLLCGKLGLSGRLTLALEMLYILYPCLFNGSFYDFHENKFLTPVILFLFYFIVSKKPLGIFGFSLLLLSIKEDAAIYLMVIAVFVMINRKEIFTGVAMLLMAIVYFVIAQKVVASAGLEGVMMTRLQDYFINGEKTFGSVIKAVTFDLGHTIAQVFTAEKMPFVLWMLAPVLFAPFLSTKISGLCLLLPILPINLMQSWQYQYNVDYQYTYGVAALIIAAAILNLMRLSPAKRRALVIGSLCVCLIMSVMLNVPKIRSVTDNYSRSREMCEQTDEVLEMIPDDASVTASDALVPHLYRIKWLFTAPDYYDENWHLSAIRPDQADYVVIDTRYKNNEKRGVWLREIMSDNYRLIATGGYAELYERKTKVRVME